MTDGTKYRSNFSVNFCVGETRVSASLTILTTRANVFSEANLVTCTSMEPGRINVPCKHPMFGGQSSGYSAAV